MNSNLLNIAIVSTNKDKYSETFIHNHVKLLEGNVHFLFDGYLPQKYSTDRGLTYKSFLNYDRNKWFNFRKKAFVDEKYTLTQAIEIYLAKNKIDVLLCEYGPSGVEMMPIAKRMNLTLIVHFHGYDAYRKDILESYGKYYQALFKQAKDIVVVSEHMKNQLLSLGCSASNLHLMPYGINLKLFKINEQQNKDITFVSCGRFVAKKAPEITIKAFVKVLEKLPEAKLVMIGDGELLELCKNLVNQIGVTDSIEFKGAIRQEELVEILNQSKIFIQPSITTVDNDSEGTPLSILEAGACGLPVIATMHGGILEVIKDGETGYLLDERDVDGLADRMYLLAINTALIKEMGFKASQTISKNYDIVNTINRLNTLLVNAVK